MAYPNIMAASKLLASTAYQHKYAADFDPNIWFPWLIELLRALQLCRQEPGDAYDWLAWRASRRPIRDWLFGTTPEERTAAYRRSIRAQAMRAANLPARDVDLVLVSAFAAIDAGKVTSRDFEGCYGEM